MQHTLKSIEITGHRICAHCVKRQIPLNKELFGLHIDTISRGKYIYPKVETIPQQPFKIENFSLKTFQAVP